MCVCTGGVRTLVETGPINWPILVSGLKIALSNSGTCDTDRSSSSIHHPWKFLETKPPRQLKLNPPNPKRRMGGKKHKSELLCGWDIIRDTKKRSFTIQLNNYNFTNIVLWCVPAVITIVPGEKLPKEPPACFPDGHVEYCVAKVENNCSSSSLFWISCCCNVRASCWVLTKICRAEACTFSGGGPY